MAEPKAWSVLGIIGGLYGILSGVVIAIGGVGAANTINNAYMLMILAPDLWTEILTLISLISPTLAAFSLGPVAPILGLQGAAALSIIGYVVIIHGILILIGAYGAWTGAKWGAILMAIIGFIGFLIFNLGGLLAFIAGVVLWYEMK
ncbi:MAG: hypothetical protein ACUVXA_19340 [Candidatus Jordarchaeum sp.]|uniref:hypothetical protein n=1 Tax=Candidatus Jordarchaeum sp. TaxID=2823881 RepID=UPI00404AEFB5